MKGTLKLIITLVVIAVTITAGLVFSESKKETYKIGVVASLSGDLAFFGEGMRNAMMLAQEQLNKDTKYNYEIIYEDDQFDPKLTANAANKLINVNKVDAIVSFSATMGNIINPLATQKKIIHFGITADPKVANGDYNFIHWTPPYEETNLLIREMQKRGHKKVGIFRMMHAAWAEVARNIHKSAEMAGIEIVEDHIWQPGEKDFRSMIINAEKKDPDIYVILGFTPDMEILTKQLKEAGSTIPITSVESFEITKNVDLYEGLWFVSSATPTDDFVDDYQAKFGTRHIMVSPNSYDIVNLIVTAVENAKSSSKPDASDIALELKKIRNFPGILGNLHVMDSGIVFSEAEVKMFKNGILTPIK